jgi:pSer/pThr/pTyr-binding forkhead associated (FHA) protein
MGLVLESANDPSVKFRISRVTTTIGRAANNDIVLNFTSVSRLHARLVVASDSIYLIDVQSSNGCEVNGERISRQMLNNGDVVTIGDLKFKFATGVPLSELEDRSMDETQALLDESIVFTRVPTPKAAAEPKQVADGTPKTK